MVKFIGVVLVLLASLWAGNYRVKQLRQRVHQLRECINILTLIRSGIQYSGNPLPRIFQEASYRIGEPWNDIFLRLGQSMKRSDRTLWENWQMAITRIAQETSLANEDVELLQPLMAGISDLDKQRSVTTIDFISNELENRLKDATAKQEERIRMTVTLSVVAGFFVVIVLI